jgi:hypothetical protein
MVRHALALDLCPQEMARIKSKNFILKNYTLNFLLDYAENFFVSYLPKKYDFFSMLFV